VAIGDINGDKRPEIAVCVQKSVIVLLGHPNGYSLEHTFELAAGRPLDVAFADCDGNGQDDLIVADFAGPGGATWTRSAVYYAKDGRLNEDHVQPLPTLGATGVSAGDLNGDGLPEIVFSNQYVTNQNRIAPISTGTRTAVTRKI
jgi:hypothetical protein